MMTGIRMGAAAAVLVGVLGCTSSTTDPAQIEQVPAAAATGAPASSGFGRSLNAYRASKGAPALLVNAQLERAALAHAQDMVAKNYFSHTGKDGSDPSTRLRRAGCSDPIYVSENIAQGYPDEAAALRGWQNSPGHDENLLRKGSRIYGLARSGEYWVMVLAESC